MMNLTFSLNFVEFAFSSHLFDTFLKYQQYRGASDLTIIGSSKWTISFCTYHLVRILYVFSTKELRVRNSSGCGGFEAGMCFVVYLYIYLYINVV